MWPYDNDDENELPPEPAQPGVQDASLGGPSANLLASTGPAMPSDQMSADQPMNPQVKDYLAQKYGLDQYSPEKRQEIVQANSEDRAGPNWLAGLAAFGAGVQGRDATAAGNTVLNAQESQRKGKLDSFDTGRSQAMQNIAFQQKTDQNASAMAKAKSEADPDSPESKIAQDVAKSMGMNPELVAGLTAAKFKEMSPVLEKKYQAELNNRTRSDNAKLVSQARADAKADRELAQHEKDAEKDVMHLKDDLDPNKARGGNLAKNQAQVDQADRLRGLYTEANGDIRNLDSRQMEELAIGMNKMLSGSSTGSTTQVQALLPKTARGDATHLREWLMNDPQGTNQVEFVKRMAETVDREREIAADQIKSAQIQRLSAYGRLKKTDPERFNQVLASYNISPEEIDESGRYKKKDKVEKGAVASGGGGNTVDVVAPDGTVRKVPKEKVDMALKAGGKLMSNVAGGP